MHISWLSAPVPVYHVGQTLSILTREYHSENDFVEHVDDLRFVAVEDGYHISVADDGTRRTVSANPFVPALETNYATENSRDEINAISGNPTVLFPLTVGKTSSHRITGGFAVAGSSERHWEFETKCAVTGQEYIVTKAGGFDTYRVHCVTTGDRNIQDTYDYAPKANLWVRHERLEELKDGTKLRKYQEVIKIGG